MKKKKQKSLAKKEQAEKAKSRTDEEPERDQAFDYGGLPARDLKKNLGCG
jgi:hypothetical protein